jgi:hypothetical protein
MSEESRADAYLELLTRLEPELVMVDQDAALASIAISLKRIADALQEPNAYGETGTEAIANSITRGIRGQS